MQGSTGARASLSSRRGSGGNRYSRLLVRLPTPQAAGQMLPLHPDGRHPPPSRPSIHRPRRRRRQRLQPRKSKDTCLPRLSDRTDIFNIPWNSKCFKIQHESVSVIGQLKKEFLCQPFNGMTVFMDIFNYPCSSFLSLISPFYWNCISFY